MTERNSNAGLNNATHRSAFIAYSPATDWGTATLNALAIARAYFERRPKSIARALDSCHTDAYLRMQFLGDKPMPLATFVRLLTSIPRETARAALQAIAKPLGLDVVFAVTAPVKDIQSEVCEAATAVGRVFVKVESATADGRVTDPERIDVDRAVAAAKLQLDEVDQAVRA